MRKLGTMPLEKLDSIASTFQLATKLRLILKTSKKWELGLLLMLATS